MNLRLYIVLAVCLFFSSCDTLTQEGESVFLRVELEEICFEVNGIENGTQVTVVSDGSTILDIGPALATNNLNREDVVGATLESATLRLIFPVESNLNIIEDAQLSLLSSSGSRQVASEASFASTRNASMTPNNNNIANIVSPSTFQASLQFDGASQISERVVIEGSIIIEVEVQEL